MKHPLALELRGPFDTPGTGSGLTPNPRTPGLKIAVADLITEDCLKFVLQVAYGFPDEYFLAFEDIRRAIVVILQDDESGECATISLRDPTKNDLVPIIENFRPPQGSGSVAFLCGCAGVPLRLALPHGPGGVLVRAVLHQHVSNLVRIAAAEEAAP